MGHGLLLTKCPPSHSECAALGILDRACIGNCKGVMLCERPSLSIPAIDKTTQLQNGNKGDAFICGTVAKPWGIGGHIAKTSEQRSNVMLRLSKKESALTKHKKWLKKLQEERDRLEKERNDKVRIKEEKLREFMDKQAKIRSVILEEAAGVAGAQNQTEVKHREQGETDFCNDAKENLPPLILDTGCKSKRPAWSLTESTSKLLDETDETQDEKDLLAFVDDLDFERFSHDLEFKVLMEQVKGRIRSQQKERNADEARLNAMMDSEVASTMAERFNSSTHNDIGIVEGNTKLADDDDVRSIAESVMSEGAVSCVHSQKSMEALVARSKERLTAGESRLISIEEVENCEIPIEPPRLVIHIEDNGARLAETKSISKLPFKNRNPAL